MRPALRPSALQFAESAVRHWFIVVEPGYSVDDVLAPEFYAHVTRERGSGGRTLSVNDKIDLVAADGSFDITVRVLSVQQGRAVVRLSPFVGGDEAGSGETAPMAGFVAKWRGPKGLWSVIDQTSNRTVAERLPTKEAALEDIAARIRQLEAA